MKILNAYCGIGGNRKLWDKEHTGEEHEIVGVELNPQIAKIYQDFFPNDRVIVADAHQYLLEHFKEFEFIWSSPPCPTHSTIRRCAVHKGQTTPKFPDMKLYEEIIFLKYFAPFNTKWVVENVRPYYDLLIPGKEMGRHIFWSNFFIGDINISDKRRHEFITTNTTAYGFDLSGKDTGHRKDQVIRNLVNPYLGLHILNESKREVYKELFK